MLTRRTRDLVPLAEHRWRDHALWRCVYCGRAATTVDHFYPYSQGGRSNPANLVPACDRCNSNKMEHDPIDWMTAVGVPADRRDWLASLVSNRDWRAPRGLRLPRTKLDYQAGKLARPAHTPAHELTDQRTASPDNSGE
ncbi:HNH endonuclease [Leifsonia sp. NCR5]|uniref:HNH endonuclease n=1 Tax=Leifsonia sp. NCR5 TaxID=1978342 RepID=UPI000A18DCE1